MMLFDWQKIAGVELYNEVQRENWQSFWAIFTMVYNARLFTATKTEIQPNHAGIP